MSQSSSNDPKDKQTPEGAEASDASATETYTSETEALEADGQDIVTAEAGDGKVDDAEVIEDAPEAGDARETESVEASEETASTDDVREPDEIREPYDESREPVEETPEVQHTRPETEAHDDHDHHGSSFASTALKVLVAALVIFALAIWALPRIAPHLPDSVAKSLFPTQRLVDERLARLESELLEGAGEKIAGLEGQVATLTAQIEGQAVRLEEAEAAVRAAQAAAEEAAGAARNASVSDEVIANAAGAADRAAEAAEAATAAATESGAVASSAMRNAAAIGRRVTAFEAQMTAISDELGALADGFANARSDGATDTPTPELVAAYNALKVRVDGLASQFGESGILSDAELAEIATQDDLRTTRAALQAEMATALANIPDADALATKADILSQSQDLVDEVASLGTRLDAVETAAAAAATAASEAQAEVGGAIREASLRSAVAALTAQLVNGLPFAGALEEVAGLSGSAPPEALSAVAASGVATPEDLLDGFGRTAQEAIAADLRAQADGGLFGQATARLRSVVAGRPEGAVDGETTAATLSRIEAAVREGALADALAESDNLSEAAAGAMSGWLDRLRARVNADTAISDYVAGLGGSQG